MRTLLPNRAPHHASVFNCTSQEIDEALRKAAELATASVTQSRAPPRALVKYLRKGTVRSEAVVCHGMVFVSGQTASAAGEGNQPVGDDSEQQTAKALEKVQDLLKDAGSSPSRVVSALVYVRNLEEDLAGVDKAWSRWIDKENPPARTVVQADAINSDGGKDGSGLRIAVSVTAAL